MSYMKRFIHGRWRGSACVLLFLLLITPLLIAEGPTSAAVAGYADYCKQVEARLAHQHQESFLSRSVSDSADKETRLRRGEFVIEELTPADANPSGALLHHWRATAFAPGATVSDFVRLMQDLNAYPRHFAPQVVQAKMLSPDGDHMQTWMRVRQTHVITVVMDTTYDVTFGQLDSQHGYSISRSTHILEIESPGKTSEHALDINSGHGFLWRQNTYWSYEEGDGGLYLQVESISLTRSIPLGLDWIIGPYVKAVPRESLEFTLRSVCNALRK